MLDNTTFYAEQGGQVADHGFISTDAGSDVYVSDVQKKGPYVLHIGSLNVRARSPTLAALSLLQIGTISVGDTVTCGVDEVVRGRLRCIVEM